MYKAKSFAKINLGLEILNKRNDGFHSIKTIMTKISLFDEIDIRKSSKNSVIQAGIEEEKNLVTKILNFMQEKYFDEKLEINIKKNIPYSSGLGGGSSNSASVIKGLNEYLKLNLDSKEMFDIALKFGSDIPFFLSSSSAMVQGRGEVIRFIENPNINYLLLICPNINLENKTSKVFNNLDNFTNGETQEKLLNKIKSNIKITESLFNGLEKSAFLVFDELSEIKDKLSELSLPNISMSGAGPSFFSIIDNENDGMNYLEKVKRNIDCKCFLVNLL
tara:strand:+ start:9464 stop:10291 length:828 start_codon:yes stop_codon:yes gene_type:complete